MDRGLQVRRLSVTRERLETALLYLSETDERVAQAKVSCKRAEYVADRREAQSFLSHEGSVADRKAAAKLDREVIEAVDAYTSALVIYEKLMAKRQTEVLIVEVFRTLESSRRAGFSG